MVGKKVIKVHNEVILIVLGIMKINKILIIKKEIMLVSVGTGKGELTIVSSVLFSGSTEIGG